MMMRGIAPPPLWVVLFFFSSPCTPFSPPLKLPVPSSVAHFSQTERIPQYFSRVRTQAREHATVMQLKEDSSNAWSLDKSGMTRRSAIASFLLGLPLAATAQDMATLGITTGSGVDAAPVSPLCDQAISHLVNAQTKQEVFLIGTAHISESSASLVKETIELVNPDAVMIELDKSRIGRVGPQQQSNANSQPSSGSEAAAKPSAAQAEQKKSVWGVIKQEMSNPSTSWPDKIKKVEADLIGLFLSGFYERLNKMGFASGEEFRAAILTARARNITIVLGDRPVNETLKRLQEAIDASGWKQVANFATEYSQDPAAAELSSKFQMLEEGEGATKSDIAMGVEALKQRKTVREVMGSLRKALPELYTALIAERDAYMARSILSTGATKTVAVVGMAHMDGIEAALKGFEPVACDLN